MPDLRTRREKLEAMARQSESPNEAEIARTMLAGQGGEPPKSPPVAAAYAEPEDWREKLRRSQAMMGRSINTSNAGFTNGTSSTTAYAWFRLTNWE